MENIYVVSTRGKHLFSIKSDVVPRVGETLQSTSDGRNYSVEAVSYQADKQNNIYSTTKNITLIKLTVALITSKKGK